MYSFLIITHPNPICAAHVHIHGYGAIPWSTRGHTLKENLLSYSLKSSTINSSHRSEGSWASSHSLLESWWAWSCVGLMQAITAEWALQQACNAQQSLPHWLLALTGFLPPLLQWSLSLLGVRVWSNCSICSWGLWWQLFSRLWLVVSFSVNHIHCTRKQTKTSPMRSESCTNVSGQRHKFREQFAIMPF